MEGIADFLDSLVGGVDLTCYAMTIGGLFWVMLIVKPWDADRRLINESLIQSTIKIIYIGGFSLAAIQLFKIILKVWLIVQKKKQVWSKIFRTFFFIRAQRA